MVSEEMARVAAHWWREKIDGGAHHDNGDSSQAGILAGMMADILNTPTHGCTLDLFEKILAKRLLEEGEKGRGYFCIGSDYGPEGCLLDSALETGITPRNFPWKTWMWIFEDRIEVRDGYRAPNVVIWPAQDGQEEPAEPDGQEDPANGWTRRKKGGEWAPVHADGSPQVPPAGGL